MAHHNALAIVWLNSGASVVVPGQTLEGCLAQALRTLTPDSVSKVELFTEFKVDKEDSKIVEYLRGRGMGDKLA